MTAPDLHAGFEELAAGYALGSLEPQDEQAFARHLAACAGCERSLAQHLETMSHLAYAADPAAPPAGLWDAIRAGVEASDRPSVFPDEPAEPAVPVPATPAAIDELAVRRARRWPVAGRRAAAITSVAAGLVLLAGLVVQNLSLREQTQEQLAWSRGMERVVSAYGGDARLVPLRADGATGPAAVVAVLEGSRVHLVVGDLTPNDVTATTYVLWEKTTTGQVTAVGAFDVRGDHDVEVVEDLSLRDPARLEALVVTHEHARTAPAASQQPPLITGTLT